MGRRKHSYHDEWDAIVGRFIEKHSPWPGYWSQSETYALRFAYEAARQVSGGRLLDLGCGRGRLFPEFAEYFAEIVALDADDVRLTKAEDLVKERLPLHLGKFDFQNRYFEDYRAEDDRLFDMILCSHVIQHLPTAAVRPLIENAYSCLVPGGYLILLTSHSMSPGDTYKLWRLTDRDLLEENLDSSQFDRIMAKESRLDRIPTHAFALKTLQSFLCQFQIQQLRCFHALDLPNLPGGHASADEMPFREDWINSPDNQGQFGIDVLVVASK